MSRRSLAPAFLSMLLLAGCAGDDAPRGKGAAPADLSEIRGLRLVQYEAGEKTADIQAEHATLRSGSGALALHLVRGEMHGTDPQSGVRRLVHLRAGQGRTLLDGDTIGLEGGVELQTDGYSVQVATLDVDRRTRCARSEDLARLSGPGFHALGQGLSFEFDTERLVLLADVRAEYHGNEGTPR